MAESVKCILTQQGKYISGTLPEIEPISFVWGDEPTDSPGSQDGVGDEIWWTSLNLWVTEGSTQEERLACIGKTKRLMFTSPWFGSSAMIVQCIGADQDGPNTLTFQSKNTLVNQIYNPLFTQAQCDSFKTNTCFNSIDVVKLIQKTITTHVEDGFETLDETGVNPSYVWIPSAQEMGFFDYASNVDYTVGYPNNGYNYYISNEVRFKQLSDEFGNAKSELDVDSAIYATRTVGGWPSGPIPGNFCYGFIAVNKDGSSVQWIGGTSSDYSTTYAFYLAPAFTIGVPAISPKGKRSSRFTVGTSLLGYSEENCDYLCDGMADDVEINAAIADLPDTGGEIILLDGTYDITAQININKPNVILSGNGRENTKLIRRFEDSDSSNGIIQLTVNSIVQDLSVDGNRTKYLTYNNTNIYVNGSNNTITRCIIDNSNYYGIYLSSNSDYNTINKNSFSGQSAINIFLYGDQNNNISDNIISEGLYGIYMDQANETAINKNNTVSGNICFGAEQAGIYLASAEKNSISGNICNGSGAVGIALNGPSNSEQVVVKDNVISDNICNENDLHGIALSCAHKNNIIGNSCSKNSQCGIMIGSASATTAHSENNLISGNICQDNQYFNILVTGGSSNNTISDNNCVHTSVPTETMFSIALSGTENNYNFITGNNLGMKPCVTEGGEGNYFFNNFYITFDWGDEATDSAGSQDGVGDEKWWTNLYNWVTGNSTEEERQQCVGKTKRLMFTNPWFGSSAMIVQCIGADQDGPNTLTFQSKNTLVSEIEGPLFTQAQCDSFKANTCFNSINVVKLIQKTITTHATNGAGTIDETGINPSYVWIPSAQEMGFSDYVSQGDYTVDYPNSGYSYYINNSTRQKFLGDVYGNYVIEDIPEPPVVYATRTVGGINPSITADFYGFTAVDENGTPILLPGGVGTFEIFYLAPAFTIGKTDMVLQIWGEEPTDTSGSKDGTGDLTWWQNLNNWANSGSTAEERAACVGKTKRFMSSDGTKGLIMICIGADQDGPHTLTFQSKTVGTVNSGLNPTSGLCNDLASAFPILSELTSKISMSLIKIRGTTEYNVSTFAISGQEAGNGTDKGEYTKGYPNNGYSYFTDDNARIRYNAVDSYGNVGEAVNWGIAGVYSESVSRAAGPDEGQSVDYVMVGSNGAFASYYTTVDNQDVNTPCAFVLGQTFSEV